MKIEKYGQVVIEMVDGKPSVSVNGFCANFNDEGASGAVPMVDKLSDFALNWALDAIRECRSNRTN